MKNLNYNQIPHTSNSHDFYEIVKEFSSSVLKSRTLLTLEIESVRHPKRGKKSSKGSFRPSDGNGAGI